MLKLTEQQNNVKSYSCLSTDTLPTNTVGKEKVSHQGDDAMVYDVVNNRLEYYVFDEANNIWRKG